MKINWKKLWIVVSGLLHYFLVVCAIVFLFSAIIYYNNAGSDIVIHDTGCDRIMKVYSQNGELLETYTGYIGLIRMDGDTTVYDWDGSCVTVQGGIVTVQDIN